MRTGKVIIKKYGNRRLYDTSGSRYVNLEDIAALIRNGNDVQVIDAKTSEDLTRVTLTQIILEDAKGQSSGLPLEMLRQMVMATDRVGRDFLMSYLKSAFEAYHKVQNSVQSTLSEVQAAAFSPIQTVRRIVQGETGPFQPKERTRHASREDELDQLRRRLTELETQMSSGRKRAKKLPPGKGRSRKKRN